MATSPRNRARTTPPTPARAPISRRARNGLFAAAGVLTALGVALALLAWPGGAGRPGEITPVARARTFTAFDACLLTDRGGLEGSAAAAWTGMQRAAAATHAQVSYLSMQGPETAGNAQTYVDTLALRGCAMIIAAGQTPSSGVLAAARTWPRLPMLAITPHPPTRAPGNVTVLTAAADAQSRVQALVLAAGRSAGTASP
ncbi:hypothetical protein KDL01_24395 [Actinospica durhamensis]|uniref:BMP family ABC transporter substrate-binding protein n=1 Tax=Actinospica durhamensis TaxID=1508375 RepID=A0A941ES12_9ACTN|nr:hypothetical protein [Actinospica durhamensis]MBR7836440.1 hypothetical protein [Actinospica durhamensis]